jgi:hypothetical protein
MKAIWSFWSKPFLSSEHLKWLNQKYHFLSWILSVQLGRSHFDSTELITDHEGAEILVKELGLKFDRISKELDNLNDQDIRWWVLGKLLAYSIQKTPFLHIDSDVYIWKPLPERVLKSDILAQNFEHFEFGIEKWYRPQSFNKAVLRANGWTPKEWSWYLAQKGQTALCCGIFGGNNIAFIQNFSNRALTFAMHPRNLLVWEDLRDVSDHCVLLEQYFLNAMIDFHNKNTSSKKPVRVECLFDFVPGEGTWGVYAHLLGCLKRNGQSLNMLANIVRQHFPYYFNRCENLFNRT